MTKNKRTNELRERVRRGELGGGGVVNATRAHQQKVRLENTSKSPCHHAQQYDAYTPQMNALSVNGLDQPQATGSKSRARERRCVCVCTNEEKKTTTHNVKHNERKYISFRVFWQWRVCFGPFGTSMWFHFSHSSSKTAEENTKKYNVFSALRMQRAISFDGFSLLFRPFGRRLFVRGLSENHSRNLVYWMR